MASRHPAETVPPSVAPSPNGRSATAPTSHAHLVMLADPRSAAAEAYRTLGVNLRFAGVDEEVRRVAVTSPGVAEGKTTTVANLAIALAEGGHRVIAVDADLRQPSLHLLFGLENREGLTTAALANAAAPLPLQDTLVPGLRVLTSGPLPPSPTELLASRKLDHVLALLSEQADYILFDTAPVAVLADTAVLAPRLDGVVLVVGAGRTRRDLARQAKEHLERVHARILGVVLSGVRADARQYTY